MTSDRLEEALHSADPDVRRQAVYRMSLRPQGTPLGPILDALSDRDWRVRREAISLAAQTREKDALIDALLALLLATDNIGLRNAAIEVLGMVAQGQADKFVKACDGAGEGARKFLVEAMGKTRDPQMIDHLESLIRGSDANVAAAAVEALVCIGGARAEGLLKEQLSTPHLFLRISIVEGLTRLGARVPWQELEPAVEDAIVRRISAELLGRTGDPQALEFLLELATDASPQTSSAALRAIAELAVNAETHRSELVDRLSASNESFRHALYEALLHGDTTTRQGAAYLGVLCRDENSLEAVIQAVADDVADLETVEALRNWGAQLIEPLLMQRRGEPRVWAIALELAAELSYRHIDEVPAGTRDRIRSLIERDLTDATDDVRAAAAESLRWWGDPRDCRALVECLSSPSHRVRAAATSALEALATRVPAIVEEALERADLDGPGGADIAHVLSRLGSARSVEVLKRGLHSGDPRTRRAVVQALAIANATDVAQLIGYAVADEDIDVQIAAVRTLGQLSTKEANAPLLTALDSPFPPIRAEAALALGRREAKGAIPRIRALLEDKEPVVTAAALDALAWLGDSDVAAAVERALTHADDEVFQAGLRAARTLPSRDAERFVSRGLKHSAWNVRMLAIKLLLEIDSENTRALLTEALAGEDDSMVRHAIESGLHPGGNVTLLHDAGPTLNLKDFRLLRDFVNHFCGIYFADDSLYIVERRLRGRLREHGIDDFAEYYRYLQYHPKAQAELEAAAEVLTTNETYFFREAYQLRAFTDEVLPVVRGRALARGAKRLDIWSAGCSSGEEVYTIAMLVDATGLFEGWDVRVFGNDISRRVLRKARGATYSSASFRAMIPEYDRYFIDTDEGRQVHPRIRSMCHFGHLNLMNQRRSAIVGRVDVTFCRNVLIYFDDASRRKVLDTIYERLQRGGYLLLGHSESLLQSSTAFEIAQLTTDIVYRRPVPYTDLPPRRD